MFLSLNTGIVGLSLTRVTVIFPRVTLTMVSQASDMGPKTFLAIEVVHFVTLQNGIKCT